MFLLLLSCGVFKKVEKSINILSRFDFDQKLLEGDLKQSLEISEYKKIGSADIFGIKWFIFPRGVSSIGKIEVKFSVDEVSEIFVPGVWIKGNKFSLSKPYSPLKGSKWIFREDRLPVPLVFVYNESGVSYAILKIPAKFDNSYDPDSPENILIYDTDIAGLGFDVDERKIIITFPAEEQPLIYRKKLLNSYYTIPPKETFALIKSKKVIRFFVISFESKSFPDAISFLWKISYDIFRSEGIISEPPYISPEFILTNLQEYFRKYFVDDYVAGFYSFVETKTGNVFAPFVESSFTGMAVFNGANSIFLGYMLSQKDLVQKGRKVINSWIEKAREGDFFWDCFDPTTKDKCSFPPFFYKDSFFTRRNFETLLAIYLATSYERDEDLKQRWFGEFVKGASAMIPLQNQDGSFSRRYSFSGAKIEEEPSGTYFAVPVFVKAYELTKDKRFLQSAIDAGIFIKNLSDKFDYFGSTLDANSEDKEAAIWSFISCYILFKLLGDGSFKTCAQNSLYASLFWFFLWNVPFSPDQEFYKIELKTLGLSSVSVENIHVDVYLFFFPKMASDFADFLPDGKIIKEFSRIMILSAMNVVPTIYNSKGVVLGIVPEVLQQTWWDYGLGGKGTYNITSATGWTVASIISAIKNYFYSPDF